MTELVEAVQRASHERYVLGLSRVHRSVSIADVAQYTGFATVSVARSFLADMVCFFVQCSGRDDDHDGGDRSNGVSYRPNSTRRVAPWYFPCRTLLQTCKHPTCVCLVAPILFRRNTRRYSKRRLPSGRVSCVAKKHSRVHQNTFATYCEARVPSRAGLPAL
jgi:hypothetical protein